MLDEIFWQGEREKLFNILFPLILDSALTGAENAMVELGIGLDWALVNEIARDWAKRYTYDLVGGINETSRKFISSAVVDWIQSGKPLPDLIKEVEKMFSPIRAEMIAVTEVTRAFAQGNLASWKTSGIVDGKRWMTAQDELVCPICSPLANTEQPLDGSFDNKFDSPPAHVRCRCWIQPVVKV